MARRRTILLVEDSADDRMLAEAAFAQLGFEHRLATAEDGEDALACLIGEDAARRVDPDLVLLDLKLPGIDGFEVLRRLRADARGAFVPVVVLTSSVEERDVLQSYRLGANSYVRKPTSFEQFLSVLEDVVRYWFDVNQAAPTEARP